jgi:hypothetical protein
MSTLSGGPNIVTDGLVLYLDAANVKSYVSGSTTWADISGNGRNGTLTNGPTYSSANGGSIVFDGVNDFASINQSNTSPAFTYEVLLSSTDISKDQMYIGAEESAFYLRIVNSRAFLSVTANGQRTLHHSSLLGNNIIYHIVSIYNGIQLKIYVNGILNEGSVINQTMSIWGGNRIGRWRDNDQRSFVGALYSIKSYNRELMPSEILQNYNATKTRFGL